MQVSPRLDIEVVCLYSITVMEVLFKVNRQMGERFERVGHPEPLHRGLLYLLHPMDALVPPDVTAELTQILSNLVLGDNEIRSKYATSPSPTQYLTTLFFQRRGRRRRAPRSQARCLSSRSHSVCHKSRHCRSGRSAIPLTFSIFLHIFYRHPNNPRKPYI